MICDRSRQGDKDWIRVRSHEAHSKSHILSEIWQIPVTQGKNQALANGDHFPHSLAMIAWVGANFLRMLSAE